MANRPRTIGIRIFIVNISFQVLVILLFHLFLHRGKFLIVLPSINITDGLVGHTIHRSIDCGGGEIDITDAQVSCIPEIDRLEDILEIEIRFTFHDGC